VLTLNYLFFAGFYDPSTVRDMLKECSEMSKFDHPNILTLKGVCLDGGPAPYIIMPFMANGSLLAYLKKNRKCLVISSEDTDGQGSEV
jgi:serine/threonine protein kinase